MPFVTEEIDSYRRQIEKIVASPEFNGSRQIRDFFLFASEAALSGQEHLDQESIAVGVLHRGSDFNPVDDASVRRIASLTRQRLEKYYSGTGTHDSVVVTLPVRCYVPQFRLRVADLPQPAAGLGRPPVYRVWILAAAAVALLLFGVARAVRSRMPGDAPRQSGFVLTTMGGDVMHGLNDLPGEGIQLGPQLDSSGEVRVRMRFSPEQAHQQAGLLIFQDADHYVKLGRHFLSRVQLEFGYEYGGRYYKPPGTYSYDPTGQTGEAIWLSIHHNGNRYSAFTSSDAIHWISFGNTLEVPAVLKNPRLGVYAYHGRNNSSAVEARFDRLSFGPAFQTGADTAPDTQAFDGWTLMPGCPDVLRFEPVALVFPFDAKPKACSTSFTTAAPGGDWALTTWMDFFPASGNAAGLIVSGSRGNSRLIRWALEGGTITAEQYNGKQTNRKDFEGSPPLFLRAEARAGTLRYSYSRDGSAYRDMPLSVSLSSLGDGLRMGFEVSRSSWTDQNALSPVSFYLLHREVLTLSKYR